MTQGTQENQPTKATPQSARLRLAVQQIKDAEKLGLRPLAEAIRKAAGRDSLAHSALGDWLNGTYTGEWGPIEEAVQAYLSSREEAAELMQARSALIVPESERFTATAETFVFKMVTGALSYAQLKGEICMVSATYGAGKTRSAKAYKRRYASTTILVECCETSTTRDIIDEVAVQAGVETAGTIDKKIRAIARVLHGKNMVIIVDEAENLRQKTIGAIRRINDFGQIGVLLLGSPTLTRNLRSNSREYGYINSRIGQPHEVRRSPQQEIADIELVLQSALALVPDGLAKGFHRFFGGDIRKTEKFFWKLVKASREKSLPITVSLLDAMAKSTGVTEEVIG